MTGLVIGVTRWIGRIGAGSAESTSALTVDLGKASADAETAIAAAGNASRDAPSLLSQKGAEDLSQQRVAADETGTGMRAPFSALELLKLASQEPSAFNEASQVDWLCRIIRGDSLRATPPKRFSDPAWTDWVRACNESGSKTMGEKLRAMSRPPDSVVPELAALWMIDGAGTDPESLARRDEVALDILRTSASTEAIAEAAYTYFDEERIRAVAAEFAIMPDAFIGGNTAPFRLDLATLLTCRIGADCSPRATRTLVDCASTPPCRPGLSLDQVIALRRSPQEIALMDDLIRRILAERRGS